MAKAKNYVGQRFGQLTVIRRLDKKIRGCYVRECRCVCGKIVESTMQRLQSGGNCNCGCVQMEKLINRNYRHGMSGTRIYHVWKDMNGRCYTNTDTAYDRYGGRGIQVCPEWRSDFTAFYRDMGEPPTKKHTIDRIDNDGNYEPSNCRWATVEQQANNKRNNVVLEYEGKKQTIRQWAYDTGLSYSVIRSRYKKGWSVERMLTTPVKKQ